MKKNFLFKGVSVLGAMLLLANVALPGMVAYAEGEQQQLQDQQQGQQQGGQEQQGEQQQGQQQGGVQQQGGEQGGNEGGQDAEPEVETCTNIQGENVAQIGDCYYETLNAAIEAAADGDTVKMVANITIDKVDNVVTISKKLTLNMNGMTLTYNPNSATKQTYKELITIEDKGDLTITGNGKIYGPTNGATFDGKVIISVAGGKLTYLNGDLTATGDNSDGMYGVYILDNGTAIFGAEEDKTGPTITAHFAAIGTNNTTAPANITVYGGTYEAKATTNNDWWQYFCAPIYAAAAGTFDIQGGTLKGYFGISSRYSNVEQDIILSSDLHFETTSSNIFIGNKTGTASDSDREIIVRGGDSAPKFTIPGNDSTIIAGEKNSYKWVEDGNDWKLGHTVTLSCKGEGENNSTCPEGYETSIDVVDTQTFSRPDDPKKENSLFAGWYKEEALTNEYDFDTPVTADITLYGEFRTPVTVTFMDGETELTDLKQTIATNTKAIKPEDPTKDGFVFLGWFKANEQTSFSFDTAVTENTVLTAKWAKLINKVTFRNLVITDDNVHKNDNNFNNIKANNEKFGWSYKNGVLTITDKGLTSYQNASNESHKWIGMLVDFGAEVEGVAGGYSVDAVDRTDAVSWGATESSTEFIMWLSDARDGQTITLKNSAYVEDTVSFKLVFKTLDSSIINFKKLTIPTEATDTYIDKIKANDEKFTLSYDKDSKELSIMDNGLVKYDNGHGKNKWIGILADFGAVVEGVNGGYGVEDVDRTDAARWGAKGTEFVMWLSDARNNTDITLKKSTSSYNDDSITFKLLFKETVTFESNGGSTVAAQPVIMGETAEKPADPTRSGYTFKGWYADKDLKTEYKFTEEVNDNITLYAKWEQKSSGGSSSGGGGGGSSRTSTTKTTTTTGDAKTTTDTKVTDTKTNVDGNKNGNTPAYNNDFSKEFNDAYQFAYKNGITTMPSIEEADMYGPLTRIAMAKMLSQYAINVLGKTPDTSIVVPTFPDVDAKLDADYNNGVTLAYQLGIMGINVNKYRPFDLVTRAEFGTALSRMLYGLSDGEGDQWYKTHLDKLMEEQIITNNNPNLQELRGYVMIMLMRSAQ